MRAALRQADDLLRGAGAFDARTPVLVPWWWLPVLTAAGACIYGAFMGSYLLDAARLKLVLYAGLKTPLLLMATTLLCLPGFFVLNTLLGLREDLRESLQAIFSGQAALGLALASLAPLLRFWYVSGPGYRWAILMNAILFATATGAGHLVMLRYYRRLIARHRYHRVGLYAWVVLYAFVGIQMGWVLRPFIGEPEVPVQFFRQGPFTNAYVVVAELIFGSR